VAARVSRGACGMTVFRNDPFVIRRWILRFLQSRPGAAELSE